MNRAIGYERLNLDNILVLEESDVEGCTVLQGTFKAFCRECCIPSFLSVGDYRMANTQ